MTYRGPWPVEQETALYELKAKGMRVSAIARELSQRFGQLFTMNIVVKKLARDRLRASNASVTKDMGQKPRVETKILAPIVEREESHDSSLPLGKAFPDLAYNECQFEITGTKNKRAYRFCGERVVGKRPFKYCPEHHSVCYYTNSEQPRRKRYDRSHK